ncbi:MAG: FxsA family protein [Alphaproteobacteria bacterium]|nr:MAG: FxsA family protein [Alphaproteobacteria bacterium]
MWLFALFVAVPLIEIALFITIGGAIGLWPTLAIVVITAIIGTALVRRQGLQTLERLRGSLAELGDPTRPLAHGAMILFAGALLLTPGFFTDTVGFLLLIPGIREALFRALVSRIKVQGFVHGASAARPAAGGDVIDGEFEEVDTQLRSIPPTHPRARPPSGWTSH